MLELREYLARYEPAVVEAAAGVVEARIDELAELIGRRLPETYRDFLRVFGADHGSWMDRDECEWDLRLDNVVELYRSGAVPRRREQLVIGSGSNAYGFVLVLAKEKGGGGAPMVWEIDVGELPEPGADSDPGGDPPWGCIRDASLEALLWGTALRSVRMPALANMRASIPVGTARLSREQRLERFHELARSLSLPPLYGAGSWSAGYDSNRLALSIYAPPPWQPVVHLATEDAEQFDCVVAHLDSELGMIPAPF